MEPGVRHGPDDREWTRIKNRTDWSAEILRTFGVKLECLERLDQGMRNVEMGLRVA